MHQNQKNKKKVADRKSKAQRQAPPVTGQYTFNDFQLNQLKKIDFQPGISERGVDLTFQTAQMHPHQHEATFEAQQYKQTSPFSCEGAYNINYFLNEQLRELINLFNMYVQLLYQTLLLMKSEKEVKKNDKQKSSQEVDKYSELDEESQLPYQDALVKNLKNPDTMDGLKYQAYHLLYDLIKRREDAINQFKLDHNITNCNPIPKYEVPWISHWMQKAEGLLFSTKRNKEELTFTTMPQVSYFQVPLLEFAPYVIDSFLNPYPIKEINDPVCVFVSMRPLLNQNLLPINQDKYAGTKKQKKELSPTPKLFNLVGNQNDPVNKVNSHFCENECVDPFNRFDEPLFITDKQFNNLYRAQGMQGLVEYLQR